MASLRRRPHNVALMTQRIISFLESVKVNLNHPIIVDFDEIREVLEKKEKKFVVKWRHTMTPVLLRHYMKIFRTGIHLPRSISNNKRSPDVVS
mmetsp:Transcript_60791/g.83468  ORF Transcript_60791/g.83468 Transcript_60791/m.83468 type:complete len:93 (+) Transcript_60791:340-618(+)